MKRQLSISKTIEIKPVVFHSLRPVSQQTPRQSSLKPLKVTISYTNEDDISKLKQDSNTGNPLASPKKIPQPMRRPPKITVLDNLRFTSSDTFEIRTSRKKPERSELAPILRKSSLTSRRASSCRGSPEKYSAKHVKFCV